MPYKPKFCCECGEKIERVDWNLLTSRRYCELCATGYAFSEKIPLFVSVLGVLVGVIGLGGYWRAVAPEKTLNVAPSQFVANAPASADKAESNRTISPANSSNIPVSSANLKQEISNVSAKTTDLKAKPLEIQTAQQQQQQEPVYFCGAPTKKGTPCSRRVKGGGRCWQHEGQAAMLPAEKLQVGKN